MREFTMLHAVAFGFLGGMLAEGLWMLVAHLRRAGSRRQRG